RAVAERARGGATGVRGKEPAPDLARELVHRGPAVAEVVAERGAGTGRARGREIEPRGQAARVARHRRRPLRHQTDPRRSRAAPPPPAPPPPPADTNAAPRCRLTR